jgi:riboflavin kinase
MRMRAGETKTTNKISSDNKPELKPALIPTMLQLLLAGAKDKPVPLTTIELAQRLNKSQQMASKHLEEMENEGLIERIHIKGTSYIKVTEKGVLETSKLYANLSDVFEKRERIVEVEGIVFEGLGEAAYYVSQEGYRKQFIEKLHFEPFPGTLNVNLNSALDREVRRNLATERGIHIEGFRDGKRTFGGAECFRAILNEKIHCAVLLIERTSHDDSVLEIIAQQNLRKALHLIKGAKVKIKIFLEESEIPI